MQQRIHVAAVAESEATGATVAMTAVKVVAEMMVVVRLVEAWPVGGMVAEDGLVGAATEQEAVAVVGQVAAVKEMAAEAKA